MKRKAGERMKGKNTGKTIVSMVLICVVLVGFYFLLNQKENEGGKKKTETNTEAQLLLQKDYDRNYPATVREVVNQYARISQCLYNEDVSEEEFDGLVLLMRKLYDEELLEANPPETARIKLKAEVSSAKENKYYMYRYQVQKLSSVKYWTAEEDELASIVVCITMNNDGTMEKSYEEFLLREDANERWKIVGWRLTNAVDMSD